MPGLTKVLVPVDESTQARHAATFAVELAALTGAEVELLHVIAPPPPVASDPEVMPRAEPPVQLDRQARPAFANAYEGMGSRVGQVHVIEEAIVGNPASVICHQAATWGADLVVMGSRGRGPLRQMLLGSVGKDVVRSAPCPVTLVH